MDSAMKLAENEWNEGYAAGFEDGSLEWKRFSAMKFVVVYLDPVYGWRWHLSKSQNITVDEAKSLLEGLDDVGNMLDEAIGDQ